ncbi:hypothetical protein D9M72_635250 [compost metagenome]
MLEAGGRKGEGVGHLSFGETVSFLVTHDEPDVPRLLTQPGQVRRFLKDEVAVLIAGDGIL